MGDGQQRIQRDKTLAALELDPAAPALAALHGPSHFPPLEPGRAPPRLLPAQERAWAASLQRAYGNRATSGLLHARAGASGPPPAALSFTAQTPAIQRKCAACAQEEDHGHTSPPDRIKRPDEDPTAALVQLTSP